MTSLDTSPTQTLDRMQSPPGVKLVVCVFGGNSPTSPAPFAPAHHLSYPAQNQTHRMCQSASSGTNTVAIDNKIEQAMDLVKSHLMFAVREEVDVLKEKITELMDRISQLEHENGILKAHATPEMLNQLSSDKGGGGGGGGVPPSSSQQQPATTHEHA